MFERILYRFYVVDSIVVDPELPQWTDENGKVYNLLELQPPSDSSAAIDETNSSCTTTTPCTAISGGAISTSQATSTPETQFTVILPIRVHLWPLQYAPAIENIAAFRVLLRL